MVKLATRFVRFVPKGRVRVIFEPLMVPNTPLIIKEVISFAPLFPKPNGRFKTVPLSFLHEIAQRTINAKAIITIIRFTASYRDQELFLSLK